MSDPSNEGKQAFAEELAVFFADLPTEEEREYGEAVMSACLDATGGDLEGSLELARQVTGGVG